MEIGGTSKRTNSYGNGNGNREESLGRNSLNKHRFVVEAATFDEIDQKYHESGHSDRDSISSMASTVNIDNINPYLMKYADRHAHKDGDSNNDGAGPTFIDVNPPPPPPPLSQFEEGQKVLYTGRNGNGASEAIVLKIIYDDLNHPHYTIKLASGKQIQSNNLNRHTKLKGATDEHGDVPSNCANFKINPTPLFQSLYQGKWKDAETVLQRNPKEASVWVSRYAKQSAGSTANEGDVRWQLLPLHLYIALVGRKKDDHASVDKKEPLVESGNTPPTQLLTALLAAYPQATQCTDDQSMIPLQSAIRGHSSVSIIKKLVEADPSSVYRKDGQGRNAFVLAERVYGKRIHREQVGQENKAREKEYEQLMNMLSSAERRVSSPARSKSRESVSATKQEEESTPNFLKQLQSENLTLRRENSQLHHRAEMNARLLHQLVEKLQIYETQISVDIENFNEVFGSKDQLVERREGILHSISEDSGGEENITAKEVKEQTEENQIGGDGAYHKRLERYHCSTPIGNKISIKIASPESTSTDDTEPTTPFTPSGTVSVLLSKLESRDEDNAYNIASSEGDKGDTFEGTVEQAPDLSNAPSESDDSSIGNTEVMDIFRPHHAETQDSTPYKTQGVYSASTTMIDGDTTSASSEKAVLTSNAIDGSDLGSVRPVTSSKISKEEEDQLCVE